MNALNQIKKCLVISVLQCNKIKIELECGSMPNEMAALPNIGGALCSTPQSLAHVQYWNAVQ